MKKNNNKDISHLSDSQIKELMERYYNNENVKVLLEEFEIDIQPSRLFKLFPPIANEKYLCPNCNSTMFYHAISKSSYKFFRINEHDLFCLNCGHTNRGFEYCKCDYCLNIKKIAEEKEKIEKENQKKKIEKIRKAIADNYCLEQNIPLEFNDLCLTHKVFLSVICKALLIEDYPAHIHILPFDDFAYNKPLSPLDEFTTHMLLELIKENILVPSPISKVEAFVRKYENGNLILLDDFPHNFYIFKTAYIINVIYDEGFDELVKKLLLGNYYDPENDADEALLLWKNIAKQECMEYLKYQLESVNFNSQLGKKTNVIIEKLLEHFSVSQIYALIWKEVASASKAFLEHKFSKNYAKNIAIHGTERYGERALNNGWDIKKYSRNYNTPQSILSEFYFNYVLNIKDVGFNEIPKIELLIEKH